MRLQERLSVSSLEIDFDLHPTTGLAEISAFDGGWLWFVIHRATTSCVSDDKEIHDHLKEFVFSLFIHKKLTVFTQKNPFFVVFWHIF